MQSLRLIAAAAIATGGLAFAAPALAAPKGPAAAPEAGSVLLVAGQRGVEDSHWLNDQDGRDQRRDRERSGERDTDRQGGQADRRQERHEERRADRGDRRDDDWRREDWRREDWRRDDGRHGDWSHDRWGRSDWNHDRWGQGDRDHRRDWARRDWDRFGRDWHRDDGRGYGGGYPYGWDRGNHYGWERGAAYGARPGYGRPGWHARAYQHPQYRYWVGRRLPRQHYEVVHRYDDYFLPRPGRGTYYARHDNDVYLVAESTRRILGAYVLMDGSYRR